MKRIYTSIIVCCLALLVAASTCLAQMYTVTDLGTLGGTSSVAAGVNPSGQVVGSSYLTGDTTLHAFRTAAKCPINPATDDLGTLGGTNSTALGINPLGQVVGSSYTTGDVTFHAFRTAASSPINPATDDLGTLGGTNSTALGINPLGQVVGSSYLTGDTALHAFRTAANSPINPATDDLGTLGGTQSHANRINASGQVVGHATLPGDASGHAFRTAANSPINPATDDLGTLGGVLYSEARAVNAFGQVVGVSFTTIAPSPSHAFRTAANSPINPATDDLGTLGGTFSDASGIDDYDQVVGSSELTNFVEHSFLYSNGIMHDLNDLIAPSAGCELVQGVDINNLGQIAGNGNCIGQTHAVLLTPIYKAFVQPPIDADGSSVFKSNRRVLPVKFTLTKYNVPTCDLLATIAVTRVTNDTLVSVDESIYATPADSGSNFRIDPNACQYVYNLAARALGVGTYRVDIIINGIFVGHAVFALK